MMRQNYQKTEFQGGYIQFLAVILDLQWVFFNHVFYVWYRSFLPIFMLLSLFKKSELYKYGKKMKVKDKARFLGVIFLLETRFPTPYKRP